ncbi:hypothetical protein ABVB70_26390, partial [Agrobacterium radiobacter]
SHRATWRIQNRRGSNRHWMKVQWQVSGINCSVEDFLCEIKNKDWRLERGDEEAIERLLEIYSNMNGKTETISR